jgi:hypothetical protein
MNLEITPQECRLLIFSLGATARFDLDLISIVVGGKLDPLDLARRLSNLGNDLRLPLESHGPERPIVPSQQAGNHEQLRSGVSERRPPSDNQPQRSPQVQLSDRWSDSIKDRTGFEGIEVTPDKVEKKDARNGPMLVVTYPNPSGRGFAKASVFDEKLFAWISGRVKQRTLFYVTRKGQYTNIVGVRA